MEKNYRSNFRGVSKIKIDVKNYIKDLLEKPVTGLKKLYWKTAGVFHCKPFEVYFDSQYSKIHSDLLKEDKFLLIVLDACRTDYFMEEVEFYLEDYSIQNVYSSGRNTFEYSRNTWDGDHQSVKYVSGATPVNGRISVQKAEENELFQGYVPGRHLDIDDVWLNGWSDELGTVPPEEVTKVAMNYLEEGRSKVVAHFFQPHAPYIGEERLVGYTGGSVGKMRGTPPDSHIWGRVEKGEITDKELKKAYRSNLRLVLGQVKRLVDEVDDDRRVVVTADHGELLGESDLYGHPTVNHPYLRKVPWMEVQSSDE